jgi:hypothetical protein
VNIEVIVRVQSGNVTADYAGLLEARASETVEPDRAPKHGEEGYGRPAAEHPWVRAEAVLEHLTNRVRGDARRLLQSRQATELEVLLPAQEAWDAERAEPTAGDKPVDDGFPF